MPPRTRRERVSQCSRSEQIRHQRRSLSRISSIRLAKLGAHPLLLHAQLEPEREEDEDDNNEPAHLRDRNRHPKKPGQDAGVDGMTDHAIRTGGDQLVPLLNSDGAAPVAAEVHARPDGEEKAGNGDGCSQPEWPITLRPDLDIKPGQRNARDREQSDRDQEDEDAEDARACRLDTLGGFGIPSFDLPVDNKNDPDHGKESFVEPEHFDLPGLTILRRRPGRRVPAERRLSPNRANSFPQPSTARFFSNL